MNARLDHIRRSWITLAFVIALPLLTSVTALLTISEPPQAQSGQPELHAALVNEDQLVTEDIGGQNVPVPAGRMLVGELVTNKDDGFNWTITDAATAQAGLDSGEFAAVVTIPKNFSSAYISSTTKNPVQATLTVQTDGSHSYLAAILAQSLSTNLPAALSSQLTEGFVENLLLGYTAIGGGLGEVASGADELTVGLTEIASLASALPAATDELAAGTKLLNSGLNQMASSLWQLAAFGQQAADGTASVTSQVTSLTSYVNALPDGTTGKAEILAQLSTLSASATAAEAKAIETDLGIDIAALAAEALKLGSGALSIGTDELAAGMPLLSEGITGAATGSGLLSSGLDEVAADIPTYSKAEAKQLGTVVAEPVMTTSTMQPALPKAVGAVAAVVIPVSLWLGALALGFVRTPFAARALGTRASNWRITARGSRPFVGLASAQAALVMLALVLLGATSAHTLALMSLILVAAVSFALLHQGLTAVAGAFAWVISVALLTVQILAAGVVLPSVFVPDWITTLGQVLPLSQAIIAAQESITGGSVSAVVGNAGWLVVAAAVGLLLTVATVARGRNLQRDER